MFKNALTYHQCHGNSSAAFYNRVLTTHQYIGKDFKIHRAVSMRGDFEGYGLEKVCDKTIDHARTTFGNLNVMGRFVRAHTVKFIAEVPQLGVLLECDIHDSIMHLVGSFKDKPQDTKHKTALQQIIKLVCKGITSGSHVPVSFVFSTAQGPQDFFKRLNCPQWKDLRDNYPSRNQQIDWLINEGEESKLGSLIIWTGIPGTGKTYALRALMDAWRKTRFIIVIDPEQFMSSTNCLVSTILEEDNDFMGRKYACVVLEDAPDFILTETRGTKGDLISKMLNLTSGLLGQGLNLKILITTNENIEQIDPAFLRPGRLLQRVEYPMLQPEEAIAWLKRHKLDPKMLKDHKDSEISLANLYSIKNGQQIIDENINTGGMGFKGTIK